MHIKFDCLKKKMPTQYAKLRGSKCIIQKYMWELHAPSNPFFSSLPSSKHLSSSEDAMVWAKMAWELGRESDKTLLHMFVWGRLNSNTRMKWKIHNRSYVNWKILWY